MNMRTILGWKRLTGLLLLVNACLICGAWIRSRSIYELFIVEIRGSVHGFHVYDGTINWTRDKGDPTAEISWFYRRIIPSGPIRMIGGNWLIERHRWTVPFWQFSILLGLLSVPLVLPLRLRRDRAAIGLTQPPEPEK